jgi:group I intron endonuclease
MQIYKITNRVNGKVYIGKDEASRPPYYGSGKLIRRAIQLYGKDSFEKEIIEDVEGRELLCEREIYWISFYNSTDSRIGYNITKGGDGGDTLSNHPDLDTIKEKISNATVGRVFTEEHLINLKKNHPKLTMEEKNMDKATWLVSIRESHAKRKGKTLEEIVGEDRAKKIKEHLREKRQERAEYFETPVAQYSREGELLQTYKSQAEASKATGIRQGDISNCIKGRQKVVKGFIWKRI